MVANTGGLGVANVTSTIYRWSSRRKLFEPYQAIGTYQVRSIEEFEAEGDHFLFVANHRRPGEILLFVVLRMSPRLSVFRKKLLFFAKKNFFLMYKHF